MSNGLTTLREQVLRLSSLKNMTCLERSPDKCGPASVFLLLASVWEAVLPQNALWASKMWDRTAACQSHCPSLTSLIRASFCSPALPRSQTIILAPTGVGRIIMLASIFAPSVMDRAVGLWIHHTHLNTHKLTRVEWCLQTHTSNHNFFLWLTQIHISQLWPSRIAQLLGLSAFTVVQVFCLL